MKTKSFSKFDSNLLESLKGFKLSALNNIKGGDGDSKATNDFSWYFTVTPYGTEIDPRADMAEPAA